MRGPEPRIVGFFPSLDSNYIGGVQKSGRDAWYGIVDQLGEEYTDAVYYEPGTLKAKAVFRAMSCRRRAKVLLVWHLHLLKLLPFIDHSSSRVILFLHGIE